MILLTGGSGFIGSHFNNNIPNDELINFDLQKPFFQTEATFIQGDIRVKESLLVPFQHYKIDCIISLAAKHHDFGIGHDEYFDTNEDGTRVICSIASQYGVKKIIFYSSVAVYGLRDRMTTEETPPQPDSPYGASKLAGENVLREWAEEDQSRQVLIIRPTLVFGANNRANMFNLIRQVDSGLYFHLGKADNVKSIAYVENLVQATLFLKDRMKNGLIVFNYADEPQLTTKRIGDTIAASLGKKVRIAIPTSLAVWLAFPFDLAIWLTGKNLPISSARIKKLATETAHSAKKILSAGFEPKFSTVDGIKKMVEWYKSNL